MLVKFEDQDYQFDIEDIDTSQARHIKRQTNLSIRGLLDGMKELDPDALVAVYWLMLAQNGTVVDMNKVNIKLVRFAAAVGDAMVAEKEARPTKQKNASAGTKTRE